MGFFYYFLSSMRMGTGNEKVRGKILKITPMNVTYSSYIVNRYFMVNIRCTSILFPALINIPAMLECNTLSRLFGGTTFIIWNMHKNM